MEILFPVLAVLARVLVGFSLAFLVPLAWALGLDGPDLAGIWAGAFMGTAASGLVLAFAMRRHERELMPKDGFLLVSLVWMVLPAYGAGPLMFTVPGIGWFAAYFEAMSAMTATGATALSGLDKLPVSVNMWRCFLQYVGGLGIILLVVAVLPLLGLGGMQLYKAETPGPMKDAKLTPRIAETARGLWTVYFALSAACLLAYALAGMSWADAFMHMFSTMGLGGFSSHDASFGFWNSPLIEGMAIFFMTLSGISFARYFIVWRTRSAMLLWRDAEVRAFVAVLLLSIAVVAVVLMTRETYGGPLQALRFAAFQVVSIATTTGYASTDYLLWPVFVPVLLIFLGCFAACAGSTGGGIKMVRMILLIKQARRELVRIIHPRVVNPVTLGGGMVPTSVIATILGFMLIYGASIVGFTMLLLLSGMDVITSLTAVLACLNNIGPGLALVGPANNYGFMNEFQLWVCTAAMLLGRLELLSVLVLFTPQFWRK